MRVIVTGGAGFIGSHVADALVARGDEVHVLDDLSKGKRERVPAGAELHVADVRNPDAVFDAVRPEAVFHLAAQADVRVSIERPDFDAEVNVIGTLRVVEAAQRHGARVAFSSTGGAIYGECDAPAPETSHRQPLSYYGTSKLCGEEYLLTTNRLYGSSHTILRYGNVYGPRQEPHGEAGVVAIFMGLLLDGGTPRIYGDGRQTRDYVYVGDVVAATIAGLEHGGGGIYNVGTAIETSVLDLHAAIVAASGIDRGPEFAPERLGELQRSVLDPSLAGTALDWRPTRSLAQGLAETWAWVTAR